MYWERFTQWLVVYSVLVDLGDIRNMGRCESSADVDVGFVGIGREKTPTSE